MIRVGCMAPHSREWLEGFHYFKNLQEALLVLSVCPVAPVLLNGFPTLHLSQFFSPRELRLGRAVAPRY